MSQRTHRPRLVSRCIGNFEHNRCVEIFVRPDGTYGFEEFRRDEEDRGAWASLQHYSAQVYPTREAALFAAMRIVAWLKEEIAA